jgi:hypothetical protein
LKQTKQSGDRIVELVHDPFLKRNNGVLGNGNVLGTDFAATGGDVAVAHAVCLLQVFNAIFGIERVHFERRDMHEESRTGELLEIMVLAQYVAHVLA